MTPEKYIKDLILEKYGSIRAFSEHIKMPYSTLTSILKNVGGASLSNVKKIAKGLHITLDKISGINNSDNSNISPNERINFVINSNEYDYFNVGIAAGLLETIDGLTEVEKIQIPHTLLGKYAGNKHICIMHVNGESMNNVIDNGATIAVLRNIELSNLSNGDIVVAYTGNGDYTVKRIYITESDVILRPDSSDIAFTDMIFSKEDIDDLRILGRVVAYNVIL